jgi:hypothetical protein
MLVPNYLKMQKRQQVLALLELGWTYRRIEAETGVRRETVSRYDRLRRANAAKAFPGSDELDHPTTILRWIRWMTLWHRGLLPPKR